MSYDSPLFAQTKIVRKGCMSMGEQTRFHPGDKVPNDGLYMEIGEKGNSVETPAILDLKAGEEFPTCANQDRVWIRVPKKMR